MKLQRLSGVLAHPISFPGKYGIGDLGKSAYDFIDFLEDGGQCLWQVLPLNPTSFGDSPYQSFSSFAGNTNLISPDILIKQGLLDKADTADIPDFDENKVDYDNAVKYKESLYKIAYKNFISKSEGKLIKDYGRFCEKNKGWLDDFALFVALKEYFIKRRQKDLKNEDYNTYIMWASEIFGEDTANDYYFGAVWNTWPEELVRRDKKVLGQYENYLKEEIGYLKFLQFQFSVQWEALKAYANERNIKIIGDIPIFAAMDSADVWANPELFYLDTKGFPKVVAGVPPDYFSETGQLWGNPLYNWPNHKKQDYDWWIKRILKACETSDIVRIDHFRGFESYWEIPFGEETAINGKWKKGPGKSFFNALKKELGDLPLIAEDLGIITDEVRTLRDSLMLPGMKILQFAFDTDNENDYLLHNIASSNSVIYTGTHDNDTTMGWYEGAGEKAKDYFRRYSNVSGEDAAWDMIRMAYMSVSAYCIIPLQDLMGLGSDARMNTPGVTSGNWQFRYKEEMLREDITVRLRYLNLLFNRNAEGKGQMI